MRDYTTPTVGSIYPGFGPAITNQRFEIKPAILNIIRNNAQFSGMATEDAHLHLAEFSKICTTFRYAGIVEICEVEVVGETVWAAWADSVGGLGGLGELLCAAW
ncbi:hypothetical protein KSP40_PGU002808 [Platanthera guangdongensis]|uniref:Uncharacterized protein n=1 Tax=Platanthera guangdongensis TaxID=2320717 RepID=A0ABR2LWY9_9ASPA